MAIISTLMLNLCKMFQKNNPKYPEKDVHSIDELINLCEKHKDEFPSIIRRPIENSQYIDYPFDIQYEMEQARKKRKSLNKIIRNLNSRRNKILAHNDYIYFLNKKKVSEDYPVKWGETEELIKFCGQFLNRIFFGLSETKEFTYFAPHYSNEDDVRKLLDWAKKGWDMREEYFAKMKKEHFERLREIKQLKEESPL